MESGWQEGNSEAESEIMDEWVLNIRQTIIDKHSGQLLWQQDIIIVQDALCLYVIVKCWPRGVSEI